MTEKFSVIKPCETTNLVTNPSFEKNSDGWVVLGGTSVEVSLDRARFGQRSLKISTDGSANNEGVYFRVSSQQGSDGPYTGSVYLRGEGDVRIRLFDGLAGEQAVSPALRLTDDYWQRVVVTGFSGGSDDLRLYVETAERVQDVDFWLDGVQVEALPYDTTYCDGFQDGCRWTGVHNASASFRPETTASGGVWTDITDGETIFPTALSGLGLPPVRQNFQRTAQTPGGVYDNTQVDERTIQMVIQIVPKEKQRVCDIDLRKLHDIRQELIDLVKPDFAPNFQELILGYTSSGRRYTIPVRYEAGLEWSGDSRNVWINAIPLRFLALQPYWEEDNQEVALLNTEIGKLDTDGFVARVNGTWKKVGTGVTPSNSPLSGGVAAMDVAADGTIYFGGDFTTDGDGNQLRRFARLSDDYSSLIECGTGVNGNVTSIKAHPNGKVYLCGGFTADNAGNALPYIAEYDPATDSFANIGTPDDSPLDLDIDDNADLYAAGAFTDMDGVDDTNGIARYDMNGTWHTVGGGFDRGAVSTNIECVLAVKSNEVYVGGLFQVSDGATGNCIVKYDGSTWANVGGGMLIGDAAGSVAIYSLAQNPFDLTIVATGNFGSAGGDSTIEYIAQWNGSAWSGFGTDVAGGPSGAGPSNTIAFDSNGNMYVIDMIFSGEDILASISSVSIWNGSTWAWSDAAISPVSSESILILGNNDIYVGGAFVDGTIFGDSAFAGITQVSNVGTAEVKPKIFFEGSGRIAWIENQENRETLFVDYTVDEDETLLIDFTEGLTVQSNYRGNVTFAILPNSDNISLAAGKADEPKENKFAVLVIDEVDPIVQLVYIPRHWSFDATQRGT